MCSLCMEDSIIFSCPPPWGDAEPISTEDVERPSAESVARPGLNLQVMQIIVASGHCHVKSFRDV